jgi:polar amino acid transport system substrate-binding protein
MNRTHLAASGLLLALASIVTGCGTGSDDTLDTALRPFQPATTTTTMAPPTTAPPPDCDDEQARRSYAPTLPVPTPAQFPPGSLMQKIRDRGKLVVAVDEETKGLSSRNFEGDLEGLEIALVNEIARAIFGDVDNRLELKTVTPKQKIDFPKHDEVDVAASAISMTCERWQDVAFTSEYLEARHALLVRNDSAINAPVDLAGRRVCVTKGSSSVRLLEDEINPTLPTKAVQYPVDFRHDCLRALQEGTADAYLGHDTFLRGMAEEDPTMRIVPQGQRQHYAMAVSPAHPEFVQYVNGVLEELRENGGLEQLYDRWLLSGRFPDVHPTVPPTVPPRPRP